MGHGREQCGGSGNELRLERHLSLTTTGFQWCKSRADAGDCSACCGYGFAHGRCNARRDEQRPSYDTGCRTEPESWGWDGARGTRSNGAFIIGTVTAAIVNLIVSVQLAVSVKLNIVTVDDFLGRWCGESHAGSCFGNACFDFATIGDAGWS